VYCQRNWEIKDVLAPGSLASKKIIQNAINWFQEHTYIHEVLITGGDPGIMPDVLLNQLFQSFSDIPHIRRIRLATRVPITLPMRINDSFLSILRKYHNPPKKEIYVVTHCEGSNEITPDVVSAIRKIRLIGISVYNQQVLTPYNTRRFQTAKLRWDLKMVGIDPYYSFYPKGKEETEQYRIPIARVVQELKEEARLLPGNVRTDESVFNVPFLGKNHLRSYQDRELIALKDTGERVYIMHPWEKNITNAKPYLYEDVPIGVYLNKLINLGEKNIKDYTSIWYYY
jgi:lysine 2,3-aminomutase